MSLNEFQARLKPVGLLYVDAYVYHRQSSGAVRLLLLKRRDDVVLPGVWQPVSGKVKEDEPYKAAFVRQVQEKTGQEPARVVVLDIINTFLDCYYDTIMMVPAAACEVPALEVQRDERYHVDHRWVTLSEFESIVEYEKQIECAREVIQLATGERSVPKSQIIFP